MSVSTDIRTMTGVRYVLPLLVAPKLGANREAEIVFRHIRSTLSVIKVTEACDFR